MHIIKTQELEEMFKSLNPKVDYSNLLVPNDHQLVKTFQHYLFLEQFSTEIIEHFSFTYEDILYSQYYWFVQFKNQYSSKIGYDAGIEQQAFLLLENLSTGLESDIDWKIIQEIESQ
jgi:hypothetical protein